MANSADFYFEKNEPWQACIEKLRKIVLSCGLEETVKWGCPCYTDNGQNVVLIHVFKEYCALLLFKGALLDDPDGILVQPTKNVQAARQIRFTDVKQIPKLSAAIKSRIYEAIEKERSGAKVVMKKTEDFIVADEFAQAMKKKPALKKAFDSLTPGRQKAYLLHFSSAKQAATRLARVEKNIPMILKGKGLNEM